MSSQLLIIIMVVIFFAAVFGGLWLLFWPDWKRNKQAQNRKLKLKGAQETQAPSVPPSHRFSKFVEKNPLLRFMLKPIRAVSRIKGGWALLSLPLLLSSLVGLSVFQLQHKASLPLLHMTLNSPPLVLALLRGETLSEPRPIAPNSFSSDEFLAYESNVETRFKEVVSNEEEEEEETQEFVVQKTQGIKTANRKWDNLDPKFKTKVLVMLKLLEKRGYPFALLEGYRSPQRQARLAAKGKNVTRAKAFQSWHQFGLAVDLAPVQNGKLAISERNPWSWKAYQALGEEARAQGFIWGGGWKSIQDYGHVEWRLQNTKKRILKEHGLL